jgi:hypothetical protein
MDTSKANWRERVLSSTHEAAMDLVDNFSEGRIQQLIDDKQLTIDEIGEEFKRHLKSYLDSCI